MILLDPDLDIEPPQRAAPEKPVSRISSDHRVASARPVSTRVPSSRVLARFLKTAQEAVGLGGQVTVLLTTDRAIRQLNRRFRSIDRTTDVLSFPAAGPSAAEVAGDLAISIPAALGQASEQGHPLAVEIKVLILHGLLHLAGYDHETDNGQMARRERLLRGRLGLPQGLIERTHGRPGAEKLRPRKAGLRP
jgi:probable rRNA maturation factor